MKSINIEKEKLTNELENIKNDYSKYKKETKHVQFIKENLLKELKLK
jgi:hypothetical protein